MMETGIPVFEARNITKNYSGHIALSGVGIKVKKGDIFGLLGPNGAGKTTLIRIINQITRPDSGELFFNGQPLVEDHLQQIGYLPEERGLYKKMKVGEQLIYLAQLKGMEKREALKRLKFWFERFEIQAWWEKKVEELSKGMAQKIQFVSTVLHEPELLILDEPFSGFDPINTNLIKDEILRLRDLGTSIIFSTHNMASVEELCDNIALIDQSKVILEGEVGDIKNRFKSNTFDITFDGSMMNFSNSLGTYGELVEHETDENAKSAIVKLTGGATTNQLLNNLMRTVEIKGFVEVLPSMNDIFIQAVENPELQQA